MGVAMVSFSQDEAVVERFLRLPFVNLCTDGLLGGRPHPRAYGTYPRVLGRYVRERATLSLEEAVRKMTSQAAEAFGFADHGLVAEGPARQPRGVRRGDGRRPRHLRGPAAVPGRACATCFVGGEPVVRNGEMTGRPARHRGVLRRRRCPSSPTRWGGSRSRFPTGWGRHTEDCVTTLRSPRGIGLLYLSAARHARGRQDSFGGADFLSRFLQSLGLEVEESDIALSSGLGCRIYTYVRETESRALDLLVGHRRRDRAAPVLLLRSGRPGPGVRKRWRRSCARRASTTPRRCTDGGAVGAPFGALLRRMLREHEREGKVFDLPARKFWHGARGPRHVRALPRPARGQPPRPRRRSPGPDGAEHRAVLAGRQPHPRAQDRPDQRPPRAAAAVHRRHHRRLQRRVEPGAAAGGQPARIRGRLDAARRAQGGQPARACRRTVPDRTPSST